MIELSVVILIIGILIAGVTQGSRLINAHKLSSAAAMTESSIVNGLNNLVFWYEPTKDESFIESEKVDGGVISVWNDINKQSVTKVNAMLGLEML